MDSHTLRVLEFEKVLALLAAETALSVGRELALEVRPATAYPDAFELLSQTAELRLIDQMGIDIPFGGARDIRPLVRAAGIGQMLEATDLVDAAQTLHTAWRARAVVEKIRQISAARPERPQGSVKPDPTTGLYDTTLPLDAVRELQLKNFYQLPGSGIDPRSFHLNIRRDVSVPYT